VLPIDEDALLTRDALAVALTEAGFPTRKATLATKANRGGGPPFSLFGRRPIYRWGSAVAWARSKLSEPVSSTAEARLSRLSENRRSVPRSIYEPSE
jgi:hypothetical protein